MSGHSRPIDAESVASLVILGLFLYDKFQLRGAAPAEHHGRTAKRPGNRNDSPAFTDGRNASPITKIHHLGQLSRLSRRSYGHALGRTHTNFHGWLTFGLFGSIQFGLPYLFHLRQSSMWPPWKQPLIPVIKPILNTPLTIIFVSKKSLLSAFGRVIVLTAVNHSHRFCPHRRISAPRPGGRPIEPEITNFPIRFPAFVLGDETIGE